MIRVKVAAVSYLNTRPFIWGIEQSGFSQTADLVLCPPADCARLFLSGEVDIALIPVAKIPEVADYKIITDYCLGAVGNVRTVEVMSNSPIEAVRRIYLDNHSRTSAALLKYLAVEYWKISPEWAEYQGPETAIADDEAVLLIGDKVFDQEGVFSYTYDLAEAWIDHTSLPVVFAAWVAHKNVEQATIDSLSAALKLGIDNIPNMGLTQFQQEYLTYNLSFDFDNLKHESLELFWERAVNPG